MLKINLIFIINNKLQWLIQCFITFYCITSFVGILWFIKIDFRIVFFLLSYTFNDEEKKIKRQSYVYVFACIHLKDEKKKTECFVSTHFYRVRVLSFVSLKSPCCLYRAPFVRLYVLKSCKHISVSFFFYSICFSIFSSFSKQITSKRIE